MTAAAAAPLWLRCGRLWADAGGRRRRCCSRASVELPHPIAQHVAHFLKRSEEYQHVLLQLLQR
jgi:hypothetical protein